MALERGELRVRRLVDLDRSAACSAITKLVVRTAWR
jgi:hypothetical protein